MQTVMIATGQRNLNAALHAQLREKALISTSQLAGIVALTDLSPSATWPGFPSGSSKRTRHTTQWWMRTHKMLMHMMQPRINPCFSTIR